MKKDSINSKLREYARTLSPLQNERTFIGNVYKSFKNLLGDNKCIQIGSYPRFTAIRPIHDLDILYVLGDWDDQEHNPTTTLQQLNNQIKQDYENPTDCDIKSTLQTHSITISYLKNGEEIFSVDVVPAFICSKNEFDQDMYKVPEIIRLKPGKKRVELYQHIYNKKEDMEWIDSDPRGYIKIASELDQTTKGEFRKATKLVKKWKNNLEEANENLKLKSFHLEQIITEYLQENIHLDIYDVVFKFFKKLPDIIECPNQIRDRANYDKFIDDYLDQFSDADKEEIKSARDGFLVKLEQFNDSSSVDELLDISFYRRKPNEEFLFDSDIKVLTDDDLIFEVDGFVQKKKGFSSGWLTKTPQLQKGLSCDENGKRYINFSVTKNNTGASEYRWKVRNADASPEPRGEIALGETKYNPETTAYSGVHYVEGYAIINNVCIARSRVHVRIR